MKITKEERVLYNGSNQFNLTDENDLIVGVVAGFSNEQNFKNALLFENAPEMLKMIEGFVKDFESNYVMNDGSIVGNPLTILVTNYKIAKETINFSAKK